MRIHPVATLVLGVGLGATGAAIPSAIAKRPVTAEVRQPAQLCTRMPTSGAARVTELARGQNAFLAILEMNPGGKVPEHRDATEEYIHVLQGSGTMFIDDQKHSIGPGTTVYMPAKAKVRFENGPTSLSAIQVFAGPGPAAKYEAWAGCK